MRRPIFKRWIRTEVLRIARTSSFNLRRLAAQVQREEDTEDLAAALLLYAHENGYAEKLLSYVFDEQLKAEYVKVLAKLGKRSAERLALRGTPMKSLPPAYTALLMAYDDAYHAPELIANDKMDIWDQVHVAQLKTGAAPTHVAYALRLDPANTSAYLKNAAVEKFTVETAQQILDYLNSLPQE